MELCSRNAVTYSFFLSSIDRMLNYGLKSQQILLHANSQSEMVLPYSPLLEGNHIQQLIILKVIMIETRCLQFRNSQVFIFFKVGM